MSDTEKLVNNAILEAAKSHLEIYIYGPMASGKTTLGREIGDFIKKENPGMLWFEGNPITLAKKALHFPNSMIMLFEDPGVLKMVPDRNLVLIYITIEKKTYWYSRANIVLRTFKSDGIFFVELMKLNIPMDLSIWKTVWSKPKLNEHENREKE